MRGECTSSLSEHTLGKAVSQLVICVWCGLPSPGPSPRCCHHLHPLNHPLGLSFSAHTLLPSQPAHNQACYNPFSLQLWSSKPMTAVWSVSPLLSLLLCLSTLDYMLCLFSSAFGPIIWRCFLAYLLVVSIWQSPLGMGPTFHFHVVLLEEVIWSLN